MEQGDKRSTPSRYADEKQVFFMSMFAFFIIFMFDQFLQSSSTSTAAASPRISFGAF